MIVILAGFLLILMGCTTTLQTDLSEEEQGESADESGAANDTLERRPLSGGRPLPGTTTGSTCADSDGGINYGTQGTATRRGGTYAGGRISITPETRTDFCIVANFLNEYYCNKADGSIKSTLYFCPTTCSGGACVGFPDEPDCTETDDGRDYDEKGTTTRGTEEQEDECLANRLFEFYCDSDGDIREELYECPYGCSVDTDTCNPAPEIEPDCTETDDGADYEERGTTTEISEDGTEQIETDYCEGNDINEYFCLGNTLRGVSRACVYGCSAGACNPEPEATCTDSDSGRDYENRGTTTSTSADGTEEETDSCVGNWVVEHYCEADESIGSEFHTCADDCSDGACNSEPEVACTDSDGGRVYGERGTTRSTDETGTDEETDSCVGNSVREYYCGTDESIREELGACTHGCTTGACNPAPGTACTDSDGGLNYIEQGTTTDETGEEMDSCIGNEILEYYCGDDESMQEDRQTCPYGCASGACRPASESFASATGERKLLIINDLNDWSPTYPNQIISVRMGQTWASLDTDATEVLETNTYVCTAGSGDTITPDISKRTVDPRTLTDPDTVLGTISDHSYHYFTVPDTLTTPYYIRIYFGTWDYGRSSTGSWCWTRRDSQVRYCDGTVIPKNWQDFVDPHPDGLVISAKMSAFVPDGEYFGSGYC